MSVPPAMWLSGLGLATVQLLIKIGAAARAVPTDAVAAATPTSVTAIRRLKGFMRFLSPG
jgi:precorrin-6B methylase 2